MSSDRSAPGAELPVSATYLASPWDRLCVAESVRRRVGQREPRRQREAANRGYQDALYNLYVVVRDRNRALDNEPRRDAGTAEPADRPRGAGASDFAALGAEHAATVEALAALLAAQHTLEAADSPEEATEARDEVQVAREVLLMRQRQVQFYLEELMVQEVVGDALQPLADSLAAPGAPPAKRRRKTPLCRH